MFGFQRSALFIDHSFVGFDKAASSSSSKIIQLGVECPIVSAVAFGNEGVVLALLLLLPNGPVFGYSLLHVCLELLAPYVETAAGIDAHQVPLLGSLIPWGQRHRLGKFWHSG